MISVKLPETIAGSEHSIRDLTYENYSKSRNAFFGKVGDKDGLFLITFSEVILANDFNTTWEHPKTEVTVKEWVDVTITVDQ